MEEGFTGKNLGSKEKIGFNSWWEQKKIGGCQRVHERANKKAEQANGKAWSKR